MIFKGVNMPYTESQVRRMIVSELRITPGHSLTISDLIDILTQKYPLDIEDSRILNNRNDTHFSQKVRNTVSNKTKKTSLERQGVAVHDPLLKTWTLTQYGVTIPLSNIV